MDSGPCSKPDSVVVGSVSGTVHNGWLVKHKGRDLDRIAEAYGCAKSTLTNVSASVSSFERWYKYYSPSHDLTDRKIFEISPAELDGILVDFFNTIKKPNGEDYNPSSLRSLRTNLARYLKENFYPCSIVTSQAFHRSQCTFKSKMHVLEFGVRHTYAPPAVQNPVFEFHGFSTGETTLGLPQNSNQIDLNVKNADVLEGTTSTQIANASNMGTRFTGFDADLLKIQNTPGNEDMANQYKTRPECVNLNSSLQNPITSNTNVCSKNIMNFNGFQEKQTLHSQRTIVSGQLEKGPVLENQLLHHVVKKEETDFSNLEEKPIIQDFTREQVMNLNDFEDNYPSLQF